MMIDIGAGTRPRKDDNWTHLDIKPYPHIELVGDAGKRLEEFANGSIAAISAIQFLEHLPNPLVPPTLTLWFDKLENGGWLEVEVPNMTVLMTEFLSTENRAVKETVLTEIYSHWTDDIPHRWGMDAAMLMAYLAEASFINVRIVPSGNARSLRIRAEKAAAR